MKNRTDKKIQVRRNAASALLQPRFRKSSNSIYDLVRHREARIAFGTLNRKAKIKVGCVIILHY